ncbi:isocitrate/isopropylmalate dehydrogenase family protein [Pelagicoccus sp. SDUM812005]|uniref:isocitrate/isopropylmalate dehydrogenase family protein n=1 Tax=Pelagicoccus sp. SDUM812005 TaxID=3041257 RepID=UPI00280FAB12|nr:isocitrate/isopropylmalate dehydrogenase family protein [Pelagicoccus sp. SDUM812005]MDQ8180626.1 isocitrate/isopropylmalate dehydrogenase family protein [Pelagicoccus sp. SDUM812005]
MPSYKIAVLPGDGIGPEVIGATESVLKACCQNSPELTLELEHFSVGAGEYLKSGDPLPEATLEAIKAYDAVLLGAMGLPSVRWSNGVEMTPQIDLREKLDLYQGVRPIKLYHNCHSPLRVPEGKTIDFVLMRENCEGLFSDRLEPRPQGRNFETDTMKITEAGAERICRASFELAMTRRKKLALVDKANVLQSMAFFRRVFERVAKDYPEVETECVYVDAMALFLVQDPYRYDVMVTENMFGDILSDLAAGLVGGMGMAPSGDIGDKYGLFQPSHGSGPTIAGKGIANPIATILSGALMLRWLGDPAAVSAAEQIEAAVEKTLSDPANRTVDLGGEMSTVAMTDKIIENL